MPEPADELGARRRVEEIQGEQVAIDDVDCTPRPRYRESREAFDLRMRAMEAQAGALRREVDVLNRSLSVRPVNAADGSIKHVASCACRWHGLEQADPEVARREYDAHPCSIADGDSIHRTYRGPVDKRPDSTLVPATAEERAAKGVTLPGDAIPSRRVFVEGLLRAGHIDQRQAEALLEQPQLDAPLPTTLDEDAEKRAALLEMT
jgi:hypothetical protein